MLVDGTGAAARAADVRVRGGAIAEVGESLDPAGETVIDAGGAFVAPGFVDCHTHYDPSVWWDPLVDPMPQHGVTTVVMGNCSLSLTPVRAGDRESASDVFGFIEDIPVAAFLDGIPWSWETYAQWRDALTAHGTAVNVGALIGHSNLRVYVMGDDAWDRAATPEERAAIADALAECACHAVGGGARRDSARLKHKNFSGRPWLVLEHQRHARGLAGTGRRNQHGDIARAQRGGQRRQSLVDGEGNLGHRHAVMVNTILLSSPARALPA